MSVSDWSTSASLNTSIAGINIAPGCDRANIDDAIRAVMAEAKAGFLTGLSVNVKLYGAIGNGTTDDRVAIRAALAACVAGDTLYFPPGNYYATATGTATTDEMVFMVPNGVNVFMHPSAWIKLDTASGPIDSGSPTTGKHVITAFCPAGNNVLQVNVDGQALSTLTADDAADVKGGTWVSEAFGVRAYGSAPNNLGADNVTVLNSHFKNLTYAIEAEGAERWKVIGNQFDRTRLSAVIWGYSSGYDCRHNITANNTFANHGDCAVAHFQTDFPAVITSECAFNVIASNTAKNCNLRTQGAAFNVEPGNNSARQHHMAFVGNSYLQTQTGLAWGLGGIVLSGVTDCVIGQNTLQGSYNGNGDFGISITELSCRRIVIANNAVSQWRGGGIIVDGSTDARVTANMVMNCGDKSSGTLYAGIVVALNYATSRPVISGNTIVTDSSNTNADATVKAISARGVGGIITGAVIENNQCVGSWGNGIYVNGLLAGGRATDIAILNNRIVRYDTGLTGGYAVELYGIDRLTLTGTILKDCSYGYTVNTCTRSLIQGGEIKGTATLAVLYDFTGSSNTVVRDMRCAVTVTTVVAAAGSTATWWNDEMKVPAVFANDAAASAGGVPLSAPYWNGTAAVVRMV